MSEHVNRRLEALLASRVNAAGAHCSKPKPKPPGV